MATESQLIARIRASPDDPAPRSVYADWLDERGDPRGELIRIELEVAGLAVTSDRFAELRPQRLELRDDADVKWLEQMGYEPIHRIELADGRLVRSAWASIFSTNDAFTWPFQRTVEVGCVFCPTDGCHLTRKQYVALNGAIEAGGEDGFFLSLVESDGLAFLDRNWGHWSCALPAYEDYFELHLTVENALFSKDGSWGVLISHEMHAVVGGNESFMMLLGERYGGWTDDLQNLREYWSGNPNSDWLEPTMSRIQSGRRLDAGDWIAGD